MNWKTLTYVIVCSVFLAGNAPAVEWEVWLSDQSNSADITAENPSGTYGSRILIYDGRGIAAAQPGTYAEDHPLYGATVIEARRCVPARPRRTGREREAPSRHAAASVASVHERKLLRSGGGAGRDYRCRRTVRPNGGRRKGVP